MRHHIVRYPDGFKADQYEHEDLDGHEDHDHEEHEDHEPIGRGEYDDLGDDRSVGPRSANFFEGADAPVSLDTPYFIAAGDNFFGSLGVVFDLEDVIGLNVISGQTYTVQVLGGLAGEISDPAMFLYNDFGTQVGSNDDISFPSNVNSSITFTADYTGAYFVEATTFSAISSDPSDTDAGNYVVTFETNAGGGGGGGGGGNPPSGNVGTFEEMAFYLTNTNWEETGEVRHTFSDHTITVNINGLTAAGQQLARWAFEAWEMIADVSFVETGGAADITFDDNDSGAYASYVSDTNGNTISSNINISTNWLNIYGTQMDDYSFATYIHEIGHSLGLGHQGNYNGTANYPSDATFINDSEQLSIMSYFSNTTNTTNDATEVPLLTAQMVDIIAIQDLYGAADGGVTAGNTIYGEGSNLGNYLDLYFDVLEAGGGNAAHSGNNSAVTIFDEGGIDTVNLSGTTTSNNISMLDGTFSDIGGAIGNVGIAVGTIIENLNAGSGNDTVMSNAADNEINTNGGNDAITYVSGNDTFDGGNGTDRAIFSIASNALISVMVSGTTATIETAEGTLTTQRIENFEFTDGTLTLDQLAELGGDPSVPGEVINGESGDDIVLNGTIGDDTISGRGGSDVIEGREGNDSILGGIGFDSIAGGTGNDVIFGNDGYDDMNGNAGNDTIYGNNGFDVMYGADGNDLLWGGLGLDTMFGDAGADTLNGQAGFDTLNGGDGNDELNGNAGRDDLFGNEGNDVLNGGINHDYLNGGSGNDTLNGGNGLDTLDGGLGDDTLFGNAGADLIYGGQGDDVMNGGLAQDTFHFDLGNDTIEDFSNNFDTIWLDRDLFGANAATITANQAASMFVANGDILVADFGNGNTLTINGITTNAALIDDIEFI